MIMMIISIVVELIELTMSETLSCPHSPHFDLD